nr:YhgE/Pip domain-containing protein [Romboutsia sp. D33t1_170424_H2]
MQIVSKVSSSASSNISSIIDAINNGADNIPQLIDSLSSKLSTLSSTSNTVLDFLNKLNAIKPGGPLENAISSLQSINNSLNNATNALNAIKGQIANGEKPSLDKLNSILKVVNDVNQISTSILNNFDSKIVNPINNIFEGSFNTANEVISVLDKAQAKLPQVEDILNTTISLSDSAKDNISFIRKKLPIAKSTIDELVNAMKKINSSDDVNELISLLKSDAIKRAEFLKQPVELVTDKLYPVANYGAGMTPFYTVLSLWVGVLLLMSLLSANVHGDYKPFEIYFGRGLTFLTIAIIQAFIVSAGDLYILNVKVIDPLSFVLLSMFTSIVFTAIVYSLVSIFGNVGKAIGVILLVIQVAASGGTFPIQVTPPFFQYVNPFLPFTYAISALRETVGGIYKPVLIKDIYVLIVFLIIPIILTILFKGIINKYTKPITDKFNESDLTGH